MSDPALIELCGAGRSFGERAGAVVALYPTDLEIFPGEVVCVAGPSGSGKTTLLNLVGLLDRPTSGEVYVSGAPTSGLNKAARSLLRKTAIGFVFQTANLLPVLTALENVEFSLVLADLPEKDRRSTAETYLEIVGLSDQRNKFPREMSGGQRQRVAVARAIAKKPKLVIADEPTASLDGKTTAGLMELFFRINGDEGTTFLFSSHDRRVIDAAGRVVNLTDGRMAP